MFFLGVLFSFFFIFFSCASDNRLIFGFANLFESCQHHTTQRIFLEAVTGAYLLLFFHSPDSRRQVARIICQSW